MKISKLFHWLYAFIMLMPVFFIAGRVAYVTFNKNAKDSYSDSYIQSTQEVTNSSLLLANQTYIITWQYSSSPNYNDVIYFYNSINVDWYHYGASNQYTYVGFMLNTYQEPSRVRLYYYDNDNVLQNLQIFVWAKNGLNTIVFNANHFDRTTDFKQDSTQRNYLIYLENIKVDTLDNAFEYSVNQLNEVPIFSWAQTSFLVAPFSYITGLFGIASTSPVNTLLSYWLSISIIWLVFDLVMYLPLLIHRWLDKGVLE